MEDLIVAKIKKYGGVEVSAMEVYRDIFHLGEGLIQKKGERGGFKTNPVGVYTDDGKVFKHRIMLEDTFEEDLKVLQEHKLGLLNGLTFFGRNNTSQNASKMYAMIFDLDGITADKIGNLLFAARNGFHPVPNYIVLSGHGAHLYYVFEEPINLYPNLKLQLKDFKYKLTEQLWNPNTSTIEKRQMQGIYQSFRVIGGKTKDDCERPITVAYRINTHPFTLSSFNDFVPEEVRIDETKLYKESKYTLSEAKTKFPEWYERVVEGKGERRKKWHIHPGLYRWWLTKVEKSGFGHRYFFIMTLAIYAIKCDVPKEEALEDAEKLVPVLNEMNEKEPFTMDDVKSAFECYDLRYMTFPRKDLERLTAISMPPNKRNGRSQILHMKIVSSIRDVIHPNGTWRKGNGRKSKRDIVQEWRAAHPDGKKIDCHRETGLSRMTINRWWNG